MITFTLRQDGVDLHRALVDLRGHLSRLRPLADRVAAIAVDQNAAVRAYGLDSAGVPFVPLAPSTLVKRARQGRMGPPLAPDGGGSPIITGFRADVIERSPFDLDVLCHWPGVDWVRFHNDNGGARGHLPVRDTRGLSPGARSAVIVAFSDFISALRARS